MIWRKPTNSIYIQIKIIFNNTLKVQLSSIIGRYMLTIPWPIWFNVIAVNMASHESGPSTFWSNWNQIVLKSFVNPDFITFGRSAWTVTTLKLFELENKITYKIKYIKLSVSIINVYCIYILYSSSI